MISPWNFPLILSLDDAIPALVAGCAVVIKPSEFTPLTMMELVRAWKEEIGAPDVLDVVNGTGETGGALVDEVDFVQFTGSERTGKVVMKRAADTLTPVSLELGGKDPMIVSRDADIERAVNATAIGGLLNTGQICISIERVYVEEPIYDEFVSKLRAKVETLRQGADGDSYAAEVGAMTSPAQVEIVADHVEDAAPQGARILTGGKRKEGPGDWYEPTVIADADHSMKVMREETFGPVIPVMKVARRRGGARMANDTTYGLGASVFAGDVEEGERIARRIEAGHCNVNDVLTNYSVLGLPMGGWKHSGIGYRHGAEGIRKFCRTESMTIPRLPTAKSEPVVPVQRAPARHRPAPLPLPQRARAPEPARLQAPLTNDGGIDGLTRWLGLRWESAGRVALTVRPELINAAGLLSGPVAFAMVELFDRVGAVGEARARRADRDDQHLDQLPADRARGRGVLRVDPRPSQRPQRGAALRGDRRARPVARHGDRQLLDLPGRAARPARPRPGGAGGRGRIGWPHDPARAHASRPASFPPVHDRRRRAADQGTRVRARRSAARNPQRRDGEHLRRGQPHRAGAAGRRSAGARLASDPRAPRAARAGAVALPRELADAVREAERWGDEELQDLGRRLPWGAMTSVPRRWVPSAAPAPSTRPGPISRSASSTRRGSTTG